ncbi:MAG: gamma-glutamyltransferase [Polyangiaceae bacterium]|nr:gamma-glutamyltransferase [Polyangiaceae bacterium]
MAGKALGRYFYFTPLVLIAFLLAQLPELEAASPLYRNSVASESPRAVLEASKILRRGGSAADAAIVAALVAGGTSPTSSGIGGGGFLLGFDSKKQDTFVLDFRETAPAGLDASVFEERPLGVERSGHLVGVPGELRGLQALHQRAGRLPFSELVEPARRAAADGFATSRHLHNMLVWAEKKVKTVPGLASIYFSGGRPAAVGARLKNPGLARSLKKVRDDGVDAFYQGPIAAAFVAQARAHGSPMELSDLKNYQVKTRQPLCTNFAQHRVCTMPPPSAGGLMLMELLQLFQPEELRSLGHDSSAYQHLIAEGMRGAIADRLRYLGDPDFQTVDTKGLLDPQRMSLRRSMISATRTHGLPSFGLEEHGTHHLATSDSDGNIVSLTTTVNRLFGAKLNVEEYGIIQNDELDDFTPQKVMTAFGMSRSPNRPRPGARPISSMTPTIIFREGQARYALGGSGGMTIATNVSQVVLNLLAFSMNPQEAVSADRIYIPTQQETVRIEKGADEQLAKELRARGEVVGRQKFSTTAVQVVSAQAAGAPSAADPRKFGGAWSDE